MKWWLAGGGVLLLAAAALILSRLGAEMSWLPDCPVRTLTGLLCPGCGTGRALAAYGAGDWLAGWRHNPLLPFAVFTIILLVLRPTLCAKRWVLLTIFAVIFAYTIMRNII